MAILERFTKPSKDYNPNKKQPELQKNPVKMAPVTPQEIDQGERQVDLSRRGMIMGLGLGVAGALIGGKTALDIAKYVMDVDERVTERDSTRREGSVRFDDQSTKNHFPITTTLVFPGFNVDEIDVSGQVLAPEISRYGQVATVDYGNKRFDTGEIAERTIQFCGENNIYKVNLLGVSMGGMVALDVAPKMRDAKIAIESSMFFASPVAQEDVIGSESDDVTGIQIYNSLVDSGIASYGGNATRRFAEGQVNEMMQSRRPDKYNTIKESTNELPNGIIMEQVEYIGTFEITDDMKYAMKDVPTGYVRAPGGKADNTVDVMTAPIRLQTKLTGDHHKVYEQEGITHANVWERPDIYGPLAIKMREDFDLPLWPKE